MRAHYLPASAFSKDLTERFEALSAVRPPRRWRLWLKTAVILTWLALSWTALVFFAEAWWQAGLAAVSVGLAMAGIGFNVQHDGGHKAASDRPALNRAMALGLDLLGGSSYVWNWKHNVHHHTNPNRVGLDVDIDIQPLVVREVCEAHGVPYTVLPSFGAALASHARWLRKMGQPPG